MSTYFGNWGSAHNLGNTHFKAGILTLGCPPESSGEALRKKVPSIHITQPGISIFKAPHVIPICTGMRLRITVLNQDINKQSKARCILNDFHNRFLETLWTNVLIVLPSWVNGYRSAFNRKMEIISAIQEVPAWWLPDLYINNCPDRCVYSGSSSSPTALGVPSSSNPRKAEQLHFLELLVEPMFSAPATLEVCIRSKRRLIKEKWEGIKTIPFLACPHFLLSYPEDSVFTCTSPRPPSAHKWIHIKQPGNWRAFFP